MNEISQNVQSFHRQIVVRIHEIVLQNVPVKGGLPIKPLLHRTVATIYINRSRQWNPFNVAPLLSGVHTVLTELFRVKRPWHTKKGLCCNFSPKLIELPAEMQSFSAHSEQVLILSRRELLKVHFG